MSADNIKNTTNKQHIQQKVNQMRKKLKLTQKEIKLFKLKQSKRKIPIAMIKLILIYIL